MAKEEKLKFLIKQLKKASKEAEQTAKRRNNSYTRGLYGGQSIAFELCARWIEEIISA